MKFPSEKLINVPANRRRASTTLVAIALLIVGGILVFSVEKFLEAIVPDSALWIFFLVLVTAILIFAGLTDLALRKAGRILGSHVVMSKPENEPPRRFVVTGISPLYKDGEDHEAVEISRAHNFHDIALPTADYKATGFPRLGNWQQTARAIYHHRDTIEAVYILRPDENDEQYQCFVTFLKNCLSSIGKDAVIVQQIHSLADPSIPYTMPGRAFDPIPPSFEDFDYIYEGLKHAVKLIEKRFEKVENKDICIDITPGLKPYSVAAAIMTLNENLKFSYVTTDGLLRFYDADVSISS